MQNLRDSELLGQFARDGAEDAFAELARRYVGLVHSVAMRHTPNPQAAQDITQAVFIILARKARSIGRKSVLSGWLYQTARLTAANHQRAEFRRVCREQEAYMQSTLTELVPDPAWRELEPLLDDAMGGLGATDRDAVVLRFFENKSLAEVGNALGLQERAAQKRVKRALEKLRRILNKRGVTLTAALIGTALSESAVQAAPSGLTATVAASSVQGISISAAITTLVKGTMKTMAWVKIKFTAGVGVAALVASSLGTLALSEKAENEPATDTPVGGHPGVTFFSILEEPPVISNAVFEKELFSAGMPAAAHKQTFSLRQDGDNYLLAVLDGAGIQVGRFDGVVWRTQGGQLTEYNPAINADGKGSGGMVELETVTRITADLFVTLGISEIKPGSAIWDENRERLIGIAKDGHNVTVDFELENGVPSVAAILRTDGQVLASIRYKYAPTFYQGQVPVEFTRYWASSPEDDKKVFTVRLCELAISDGHLESSLVCPPQVPKIRSTYYSNNIAYWTDARGTARRVLTAEENAAEIEKIRRGK